MDSDKINEYIVLDDNCKDAWWKKVLRYFWISIPNRTGCIKLKWFRKRPLKLTFDKTINASG
jgi:hypothetical protein